MTQCARKLFLTWLLLFAAGCSRPPVLVSGPIEVTPRPAVVRFTHQVSVSSVSWEMCFEFDVPRDSHAAGRISITLPDDSGTRYQLENLDLDRRGESVVCQLGRLTPVDPAKASAVSSAIILEAAELSAPSSLRLHGIRGGEY